MTITIGTWIFPLMFTLIMFAWVHFGAQTQDFGGAIAALIVAVPGSLTAWLVWAVLS